MSEIPLGRTTDYPAGYAPDLLFPIARAESRGKLGLPAPLPFRGVDLWTAWELTWLDASGKPRMKAAEIRVPADSPNIVESKSMKLYLNGFAMQHIDSEAELAATISSDLSTQAGAEVAVRLIDSAPLKPLPGHCLDDRDCPCDRYDVDPGLLETGTSPVAMTWHSALLRSLCPVTAQPDFASIMLRYEGPEILPDSLLRYLVSFREHQDFHEACVERIFNDLLNVAGCNKLSVYARYQRRGGLDINPFRSNFESEPPKARLWNQ